MLCCVDSRRCGAFDRINIQKRFDQPVAYCLYSVYRPVHKGFPFFLCRPTLTGRIANSQCIAAYCYTYSVVCLSLSLDKGVTPRKPCKKRDRDAVLGGAQGNTYGGSDPSPREKALIFLRGNTWGCQDYDILNLVRKGRLRMRCGF